MRFKKLSISLCVAATLAVSGSAMAKGGGGGGGVNMTIGTDLGLYLVDMPFPGEASVASLKAFTTNVAAAAWPAKSSQQAPSVAAKRPVIKDFPLIAIRLAPAMR